MSIPIAVVSGSNQQGMRLDRKLESLDGNRGALGFRHQKIIHRALNGCLRFGVRLISLASFS